MQPSRRGIPSLSLPAPAARAGIVASVAFLLITMSVPVLSVRGSPRAVESVSPWVHSARVSREPVLRVADAVALREVLQRWGWNEGRRPVRGTVAAR